MSYEGLINELFNRVIRYMKAQPLNLGGYTAASGGAGGPPGGFTGYLPQVRMAFDETEAEIWPIPSGPTLVDNLNRIRFRLADLEASGVGGSGTSWDLVVEDDSVVVLSGVTVLNFIGGLTATQTGSNEVTISGITTVSGGAGHTIQDEGIALTQRTNLNFVGAGVTVVDDSGNDATLITISISGTTASGTGEILTDDSILINSISFYDDLTDQVPTTSFTTLSGFVPGTLKIYYNGIRQRRINYTEGISSFTTGFVTSSGDTMIAEYDLAGYAISTILFDDSGDVLYEY